MFKLFKHFMIIRSFQATQRTCYVTFRGTSNAKNSELVTGTNDKRMLEKEKKVKKRRTLNTISIGPISESL